MAPSYEAIHYQKAAMPVLLSTDVDEDCFSVADSLLETFGQRLSRLRSDSYRTAELQRALIAEMAQRGSMPMLSCTGSFVEVGELT